MTGLSAVQPLLAALDREQRAAALLPDGPAQILAPAGSGKTTTLIARLGVLLERGVDGSRILVLTFNRDAARELAARIESRLVPLLPAAAGIEVRTLHALGRRILVDAGDRRRIVADRSPLLRVALRRVAARRAERGRVAADSPTECEPPPDLEALDTELSALKLEGRAAPPASREVIDEYGSLLAAQRAVDFDDLVARSVQLLDEGGEVARRWQRRFTHVLVDEFQDVDAAQARLIGLLAVPERNLFVVGDDDQTIYAWRLADVRRILDFSLTYPDASRVTLATNYRCPAAVVHASRQLIDENRERFPKPIRPRRDGDATRRGGRRTEAPILVFPTDRPSWAERLVSLVADAAARNKRVCFLARTGSELTPVALALIRIGVPHAISQPTPLDAEPVRTLVDDVRRGEKGAPFQVMRSRRVARGWARGSAEHDLSAADEDALDAAIGWAASFPAAGAFIAAFDAARARLADLRRPDALVQLMTVHSAKGLEFPLVVILGFEEGRFPNRRAVVNAADPGRAVEEERRLAYVALTRASERLILCCDPARPSRFMTEMGVLPAAR